MSIALVGLFLTIKALPALRVAKFSFLTTQAWEPDVHHFGIAGIMEDTVLIAVVAVVIAIPVALGLSLYISEVAPAPIRRTLVSLVDLMAAVPSIVYGLWALEFLQGRVVGLSRWLTTWFGWFPLFKVDGADPSNPVQSGTLYSASTFIVGIAVSLMVIPIICSVTRESFTQAPLGEREGAYALGATRWGMIRSVVLPFGKGGIIGGTMLGFGRALGETIVVILIISPIATGNLHILQSGGNSISGQIANLYSESSPFGTSALMAAGLALFALTLVVNFIATGIVVRSRRARRATPEMTLLDRTPAATTATDPDRGPWEPAPQRRRKIRGVPRATLVNLFGAALAGVSCSLLLTQVTGLSGLLGVAVVAYVFFVVVYAVLVSLTEDRPAVLDAVMTVLMASMAVLALAALGITIGFTLARGWSALVHLNTYTQDLSNAGPLAPLSVGGIGHAIVGTLWEIGIAVVLTVPLGLVAAVYLDMSRTRPSGVFRTIVVAMTALPSILAGLFVYALWILTLGFQKSGLAAALALSVMMLPYMIRAADLALRLVPGSLREASAALGAPSWRGELGVVIPTARSGLATAVILGIARGIGEASPVLLTAGYTTYINGDPLHGAMASLPLAALKLVQLDNPAYTARAFACASFLLLLVIVLFVTARKVGGWGPGHLSERGMRRVRQASARDAQRFARATAARPDPLTEELHP